MAKDDTVCRMVNQNQSEDEEMLEGVQSVKAAAKMCLIVVKLEVGR
jgi:hypothetical protein